MSQSNPHAYLDQRQDQAIAELREFVAIPSIAAQSDHADDVRRGDARMGAEVGELDLGEARVRDATPSFAVGVATIQAAGIAGAGEPLDTALPAATRRGYVLDEEEAPTRFEDAPNLGEGRGGIGDRAEDEGTDDRIDARGGERDALRRAIEEGQRSSQLGGALREVAAHGGARLDGGQGDVARQIGEVHARPRPDLHDRASEVGEERPLVPPVIGVVRAFQAFHQPGGEWAEWASGHSETRRRGVSRHSGIITHDDRLSPIYFSTAPTAPTRPTERTPARACARVSP